MFCFWAVLAVLTLFKSYSDAETFSKNTSVPYVPGKCLYKKTGYLPGEHQLPDCTRLICSASGWASAHSCIDSSLKGCVRGEQIDADKPFPECCKREYTCKHGDGSEYKITDF